MPVTFGTVRVVPPASQAAPSAPAAAAGGAPGDKGGSALDPRDLARAMRGIHLRGLRLRAH